MNFDKNLKDFQQYLSDNSYDYAIVFSNDEFLKECSDLNQNARYLLSGFSGTAGDMLISADNAYIFVDGRYHIQVDEQVNLNLITPIKLKMGETRNEKIFEMKKSGNAKIYIEMLLLKFINDYIEFKAFSADGKWWDGTVHIPYKYITIIQ